MIIWRGYGFLVVLLAICGNIFARIGAEQLWGKPLPIDKRQAAELVGMLLAAALIYLLHIAIQWSSKSRVVIDKETGQEITLLAKHDLFFIPVKYWALILASLGVIFFFQK